LERSPGGRARLAEAPACPRCGCDLALVRRAEAQARQFIRRALRAWAQGNHSQASAWASASLAIEQGRLGRAVLNSVSSKAAAVLAADQGDRCAG
jgi:hypothetical protein